MTHSNAWLAQICNHICKLITAVQISAGELGLATAMDPAQRRFSASAPVELDSVSRKPADAPSVAGYAWQAAVASASLHAY